MNLSFPLPKLFALIFLSSFAIEAVNSQGKGWAKGHGKGKGKGQQIRKSDLEEIKDDLSDIVQGLAIGSILRLAFHDCVGKVHILLT